MSANPKLVAMVDGWALETKGVTYKATRGATVLGTLIWSLGAEAAFETAEGQDGDPVILRLAQHWCSLTAEHGENVSDVLEQDLYAAAALAPDTAASDHVYSSFFYRIKQFTEAKKQAGLQCQAT
jgi:hypothetical protein